VKLLLDTHLLLWAAGQPELLSRDAHELPNDPDNYLLFGAANMWEVAIGRGLGLMIFGSIPGCCDADCWTTAWRTDDHQ